MTRAPATTPIGPLTPHLYEPSAARPVRVKLHRLTTDTRVVPHHHPWGQIALSATGVVRLTVEHGNYLVPPSRAIWVPPGVQHAVTVIEDADLLTLYLRHPPGHAGSPAEREPWQQCRVLEVSDLLRALLMAMDHRPDGAGPTPSGDALRRERRISALVLDELRRARPVRLGVDLPGDKRLRALCQTAWARDSGASPRTVARLFRQELGTTFVQWRQQVLLAKALAMAARRVPMSTIAAELGYASPSAFSAMVRRSVGAPPSRFFA